MIYDPIPVIIFILIGIFVIEFPVLAIIVGIGLFIAVVRSDDSNGNNKSDIQVGHDNIHRD